MSHTQPRYEPLEYTQQNQSIPRSDSHTLPGGPDIYHLGRTNETISPPSNPFASLDDADAIQLDDFVPIHISASGLRAGSPKFVSQHPSHPLRDMRRDLTGQTLGTKLDYDAAVSEWETVAPDEEFQECLSIPLGHTKLRKDVDVLFHAQDILHPSRPNAPITQRRNTILVPPNFSLPKLPSDASQIACARNKNKDKSFYSSSSVYSNVDGDGWIDEEQLLGLNWTDPWRTASGRRRVAPGAGRNNTGELVTTCSKTSSSASVDRFRYDGDGYSIFLQSTAERDISQALHNAGVSMDSGATAAQPNGREFGGNWMNNKLNLHHAFYNHAALQST